MPASFHIFKVQADASQVQTREVYWQRVAEAAWRRGRACAEAGDLHAAEFELDRARRISPVDGTILFDLASVLVRTGNFDRAAELFEQLALNHDLPDAWCGLSAAALATGDSQRAARALSAALSRAAPGLAALALGGPVTEAAGAPGWCGLDGAGRVRIGQPPGAPALDPLLLDGVKIGRRLPPGWSAGWSLRITAGGVDLLGSPISIPAITGLQAFVWLDGNVLQGWAWHPGDPDRLPRLILSSNDVTSPLVCRAPAEVAPGMRPLARPRLVPPTRLIGRAELRGPGGEAVPGSPLDPTLFSRMAAEAARLGPRNALVPVPICVDQTMATTRPVAELRTPTRPRGVSVVVPVHGNTLATLACLESVGVTAPRGTEVIVVDDASRDPALLAVLDRLARQRRVRLIRLPHNVGFPTAANAGLQAASDRDVVLLNSDTLMPPGWLERLRAAAYSAPDIGTATPLSNDATILTYRAPPAPVAELDRLAQSANGTAVVDVPTGVGFCLYLRRDCLDEVGLLRADLFSLGYGEENDLCFRARALGWRSVAATGVFVHHEGAGSFGAVRTPLMSRNGALLEQMHPGHDRLIAAWVTRNPLGPALRRMDALRWQAGRQPGSVVMVTHGGGGGVDRVLRARCETARSAGLRPIVLRPDDGSCTVSDGMEETFHHLRFSMPHGLRDLVALLRRDRPRVVEMHHNLGHSRALDGLSAALGVPCDIVVHDYAAFCPRISLVSTNRRYCGEPPVSGCEHCVADLGSLLDDESDVRSLLARSAAALAGARRVIAPSTDAANRLRRHFPGTTVTVQPWQEPGAFVPAPAAAGPIRRVCVVGAVGTEKGYDILLACLRDARTRTLPIEFVLVGYSNDDERLLGAGPIRITGAFEPGEAHALIAAQEAHLAFLPSVWPETWCFALDDCWSAGLPAAVFDLGAPADRVRATGRGWVLPFNLPPSSVNDALLSCSLPRQGVT